MVPGWKLHLLKGERGAPVGKFLVLLEIESVEARDRYFPNPGEESEEVTRFFEQHPEAAAALEKWNKMGPFGSKTDIPPITSPSRSSPKALPSSGLTHLRDWGTTERSGDALNGQPP